MGAGCEGAGVGAGCAGGFDEAGGGAGVWVAGGFEAAGREEELESLLPLDAGGAWLLEELEVPGEMGLEPEEPPSLELEVLSGRDELSSILVVLLDTAPEVSSASVWAQAASMVKQHTRAVNIASFFILHRSLLLC